MKPKKRMRPLKIEPETWFWLNTERNGECLESTFAMRSPTTYPVFTLNYKTISAHRYAWTCFNGPIPEGLCVCHTCDNHKCVRIEHLFLGTPKENHEDMMRKGRGLHGERIGNATMTNEKVAKIKKEFAAGTVRKKDLARKHAVDYSTLCLMLNGKTWRSVEPAK